MLIKIIRNSLATWKLHSLDHRLMRLRKIKSPKQSDSKKNKFREYFRPRQYEIHHNHRTRNTNWSKNARQKAVNGCLTSWKKRKSKLTSASKTICANNNNFWTISETQKHHKAGSKCQKALTWSKASTRAQRISTVWEKPYSTKRMMRLRMCEW